MNKGELVEAVMNRLGGSKKGAENAVDAVFDVISDSLRRGDDVSLSGFGTFLVKKRAARMARNPRTGAAVHVAEKKVPRFRAGKGLKDAVA